MIDYHCHLLPALDDGPESVEESLEMARALAAFGFRTVHCTPHCIAGQYEISPVEVREAIRKLQARLDGEGIALRLHPGMEYYLDECFERFAANLLPLGDSKLVLCEAPPQAPPGLVCEMASLIVVQGYTPLIAHPERSEPVWRILEGEERAKEQGGEVKGQGSRVKGQEEEGGEEGAPEVKTASWWRRLFSCAAKLPASDASRVTRHDTSLPPALSELPESCLFQANLGAFTGFYGAKPQRRAYELLQRGGYACFASDLHDANPPSVELLERARDKVAYNPALQKLATFQPPRGEGGSDQMAFW